MSETDPTAEKVSEPTYMLAEAQRELARRQCQRTGHEWDILSTVGNGPVRLTCGQCGWSGSVTMDELP